MNVIFISPNYPENYYNFCARLKELGTNVLGIGEVPSDGLSQECQDSLTEYYSVSALKDYDQVYRAVAYFISRYGRIDYIESQSITLLDLEARLRDDFNMELGYRSKELDIITMKSKMKNGFRKAKIGYAPHQIVQTLRGGTTFAKRFAFPVIIKADNIMEDGGLWKCDDEAAFVATFEKLPKDIRLIIEPFMQGHIETYDGIADSQGNVIFAAGQVMMNNTLSVLENTGENVCYTQNMEDSELNVIGPKMVKAFGITSCFFHFKFIRMEEDRPLIDAKRGDLFAVDISTCAPVGYVPTKMNYAYDVDVYKIWAECLCCDTNKSFADYSFKRYVAHFGRSAKVDYMNDADTIKGRFGDKVLMHKADAESIPGVMSSDVFMLKADTLEGLQEQTDFIMQRADGKNWN